MRDDIEVFATALTAITGNGRDGQQFRSIMDIFLLCDIGWQEIEKCQQRHPADKDAIIRKSSPFLYPSPVVRSHEFQTEILHRAHCRELLERVVGLHDERPDQLEKFLACDYPGTGRVEDIMSLATDAELVVHYMRTSLAAPLNSVGFLCYATVFRSVFGEDEADRLGVSSTGLESLYGQQAKEEMGRARKRAAVSRRPFGGE